MKRPLIALVFSMIASSSFASGHCSKDEVTYFSCEIKGSKKTASVCGSTFMESTSNNKSKEWIQYRFGAIGKVEIEYPEKKLSSFEKFNSSSSYFAKGGNDFSIGFSNGSAKYKVSVIEADENFYGVIASINNKEIEFRCATLPESQWVGKENGFYSLVNFISNK